LAATGAAGGAYPARQTKVGTQAHSPPAVNARPRRVGADHLEGDIAMSRMTQDQIRRARRAWRWWPAPLSGALPIVALAGGAVGLLLLWASLPKQLMVAVPDSTR